ncbi:MotA/TolQ/ExbB proton channel family protein [Asticcacaulis sp. SL142]|uniref:MotA/TolQ/ExbB proton channel family protein n=1 Tax=Asticcacaulis sp. SL142 TaxID=2995155 RepID=UPI00226C76FB|nr:MotA/TolQ/ExbB proton channel family protein [Asticcacaulis sp. SL142]WAC48250.1 MotA/TolQ/ExbB proton channel family protein [Asticcacaulis sp. SL142]
MPSLELQLYSLTPLFQMPVMALILLCLVFALYALGGFVIEWGQRFQKGYAPLFVRTARNNGLESADVELLILKKLEGLRIVSRTAPMLGLVATMIPMGPALMALSTNQAENVSQHLVAAFSAVIIALIAASVTFYIQTVRRRWLLQDLRRYERGDI